MCMTTGKQWLVHLLMLAILVLPGQSLFAQTEMASSTQNHECPHMQKQHMQMSQHQDDQQAMDCCDQDAGHCNAGCGDCFHCPSFSAVITDLQLDISQSYLSFLLPLHEMVSGLPPAAQFRPPRTLI